MKKGKLIILSGPSGVGKDTLIKKVLPKIKNLSKVVTATSRAPREGEVAKIHYHFFEKEEFAQKITEGYFFEYVKTRGDYYGTPKNELNKLNQGINLILNMEVVGAEKMKRLFPDCIRIFVKPDSLAQLERQLKTRGKETDEQIRKRIQRAQFELSEGNNYDYQIINYYEYPERACQELLEIIKDLTE